MWTLENMGLKQRTHQVPAGLVSAERNQAEGLGVWEKDEWVVLKENDFVVCSKY